MHSSKILHFLADLGERAGKQFVQQFVVILLATGSAGLVGVESWAKAADSAALSAVASIVLTIALVKLPTSGWPELIVRTVKTFVASVGGSLAAGAGGSFIHADWRASVAVAVPVTLIAFVMGLAAMANPALANSGLLAMPVRDFDEPTAPVPVDVPVAVTPADPDQPAAGTPPAVPTPATAPVLPNTTPGA